MTRIVHFIPEVLIAYLALVFRSDSYPPLIPTNLLQGQGFVWRLVRSLPSRETETGPTSRESVIHRKSCLRATHETIPERSRKVKLQCDVTTLGIKSLFDVPSSIDLQILRNVSQIWPN